MVMFFVVLLILISGIIFSESFRQNKNIFKREQIRKRYIFLVSVVLILQSGLRNLAVGADTYGYSLSFQEISSYWSWKTIFDNFTSVYVYGEGKDAGYAFLQKIFQVAFDSYRLFLLAIAVLFFYSLGTFIYRNTSTVRDAILAFLLYLALFYEFYSITGLRQTIAGSLCLIAFKYLQQRRSLRFLLFIMIASFVHKTALIFIPFYLISKIDPRKIFLPALIIFPFLMIFRNKLISLIASLSNDARIEQYFSEQFEGAGTLVFTSLIFLIAFWTFFDLKELLLNKRNYAFINAVLVAMLLTPLTWFDPSLMRLVMYYSIFLLVLIPLLLKTSKMSIKVRAVSICFVVAFLSFFAIYKNQNYAFFWQEMKLGSYYEVEKIIQE